MNCTPDSFYDGEQSSVTAKVEKALQLVEDGAHIIDIGGESSRPGAEPVSVDCELERVIPVIEGIRTQCSIPISIDTTKAEVAKEALKKGVNMVNDISSGADPDMFPLVAQAQVFYVAMHMQGQPQTMQKNPQYENVTHELVSYLTQKSEILKDLGLNSDKIIWDPGIGFGKTLQHNLEILASLENYVAHAPVLLGVSRKSFIEKLDPKAKSPAQRLSGSLAPLSLALDAGVRYLRVHDVRETSQYISVYQSIKAKRQEL
ncbi:MAG: dihydropteroate synthase [Planctomycetes bacterium]|nr:dihydropteroate synthase [Planctomycetota bacterium]